MVNVCTSQAEASLWSGHAGDEQEVDEEMFKCLCTATEDHVCKPRGCLMTSTAETAVERQARGKQEGAVG